LCELCKGKLRLLRTRRMDRLVARGSIPRQAIAESYNVLKVKLFLFV
jgi:hypothetical protein